MRVGFVQRQGGVVRYASREEVVESVGRMAKIQVGEHLRRRQLQQCRAVGAHHTENLPQNRLQFAFGMLQFV